MPGFRTHTTVNLVVLGGLGSGGFEVIQAQPFLAAIAGVSFLLATVFLSPDLDLAHSSPTRNWGFLRWIWRPYQMMFKHRGLSHSVFFSSATRVLYLLFLAVGLLAAFHWATGDALAATPEALLPTGLLEGAVAHRWRLAAAGAGIFASDLCHIVTDRAVSFVK